MATTVAAVQPPEISVPAKDRQERQAEGIRSIHSLTHRVFPFPQMKSDSISSGDSIPLPENSCRHPTYLDSDGLEVLFYFQEICDVNLLHTRAIVPEVSTEDFYSQAVF